MSTTRVGQRLRAQVLVDAGGHCGYCRLSEEITGTPLEIEHIVPEAHGGPTRRANLWAVCRYCNLLKSDRVATLDPETGSSAPLFNPREQRWSEHFAWIDGSRRWGLCGASCMLKTRVMALLGWEESAVLISPSAARL